MKNKDIKSIWKFAKTFWIASFLLWIAETIIFLIIEGWHLKATNPVEVFLDNTVQNMWITALNATIFVCFYQIIRINNKTP